MRNQILEQAFVHHTLYPPLNIWSSSEKQEMLRQNDTLCYTAFHQCFARDLQALKSHTDKTQHWLLKLEAKRIRQLACPIQNGNGKRSSVTLSEDLIALPVAVNNEP
eukprot:scaffold12278_cov104-Skeletonema_dohrnii-CCMP3373.AAC.2